MKNKVLDGPVAQVCRKLGWIGVYAIAMGLLEAICVIYLRRLLLPAGTEPPAAVADRLKIEIIREACTLAMILAVAWLTGHNLRARSAYFFFIFGLWDIFYYAGLKWLADWPASWLQWDCLFLIPKPWYGPVLAPVLISVYFAYVCGLILVEKARNRPIRVSWLTVGLQLLAGVIWYWSFVKDTGRIVAQGYGDLHYSWLIFSIGLAVALLGVWVACATRIQSAAPTQPSS